MKKFLMCCGTEKGGTTWLHQYFKNHPEYTSIGKELNLIQRDDFVPDLVGLKDCRKNIFKFFDDIALMQKVTGDFTHYEGSTENIFRLFKTEFQKRDIEVVPVYIMRDPIRRAWSAWNMLQANVVSTYDMPIAAEKLMTNMLACKYKETVQALDNVFENPLYFFYEEFFTQDNINSICTTLQIAPLPANFDRINRGAYTQEYDLQFVHKFGLCDKNKEAVKFIFERFDNVPWNIKDYS